MKSDKKLFPQQSGAIPEIVLCTPFLIILLTVPLSLPKTVFQTVLAPILLIINRVLTKTVYATLLLPTDPIICAPVSSAVQNSISRFVSNGAFRSERVNIFGTVGFTLPGLKFELDRFI